MKEFIAKLIADLIFYGLIFLAGALILMHVLATVGFRWGPGA